MIWTPILLAALTSLAGNEPRAELSLGSASSGRNDCVGLLAATPCN